MQIQPYLFFEGRTEEAIEFYKKAVGAKVEMLMRYSEAPDDPPPGMIPPGSENKVMHSSLKIGDATVLASDGKCSGKTDFDGFSLTLVVDSEADAERRFKALGEGGKVTAPLNKTFFASRFGMLQDRFGVGWMVLTSK